jgi:hypothetical protein
MVRKLLISALVASTATVALAAAAVVPAQAATVPASMHWMGAPGPSSAATTAGATRAGTGSPDTNYIIFFGPYGTYLACDDEWATVAGWSNRIWQTYCAYSNGGYRFEVEVAE